MLCEVIPACWRQKPDAVFLLDVFRVPALLSSSGRHEAGSTSQTRCSHLLQASGLAEVITEHFAVFLSITTPCMQHLTFTYVRSILPQVAFACTAYVVVLMPRCCALLYIQNPWQLAHPFSSLPAC
jgi:hypothetical protein